MAQLPIAVHGPTQVDWQQSTYKLGLSYVESAQRGEGVKPWEKKKKKKRKNKN
jgi:hypothetical protein